MNKLLTKVAKLALGLSLAAGVGVAIGTGSKTAERADAVDVTYNLTINGSDFNTTSYAANNNEKTSNAVCTTDNTKTFSVKWTSNQVMKNGSNMQWQKSKGYIYNSTNLGTINSVTVNSSAGSFTTYYGTTIQPSSGTAGSGKGYFKTSVGSATGTTSSVVINFTVTEGADPVKGTLAITPVANNELEVGDTGTLSYTLTGGTHSELTTVMWESDDTSVLTIDEDSGEFEAIAVGSATVTLVGADEDFDDYEATYDIDVVAPAPKYTDDTSNKTITWDLSVDSTQTASTSELSWTSPKASVVAAKASASTNTNNYYPGTAGQSYTSTRFYKNSTLTFAPANGYKILSIVTHATTDTYATNFSNSTWTNATSSSSSQTVTITPTSGTSNVVCTLGNTVGLSEIVVHYGSSATLSSIAVSGSMTNTSYYVGDDWDPAGLVVTATYSDNSTSVVTSSATWTYSPVKANSTSVVSVTATASYTESGVTKTANSAAQSVTVSAAPSSTSITIDTSSFSFFTEVTVHEEYTLTQGLFTLHWLKNSGNNIADYSPIRIYGGHTMTITGATGLGGVVKITSVVFNCGAGRSANTNSATTTVLASSGSISSTSSNDVVTYTMTGTVTSFSVAPGGRTDWNSVTINYVKDESNVPLTSISASNLAVDVSQQVSPIVTFNPVTATNKGLSYAITSGSAYAEVDANGVVTGLGAGTAQLTITPSDTNASAITINVVVSALPSIHGVTVGSSYAMVREHNSTNYELTSVSTYGSTTTYSTDPSNSFPIRVVNGIYAHTVALEVTVNDETQYLSYDAAGNSNTLNLSSTITREACWIFLEENSEILVRNVEAYNRILCFNTNYSRFACYPKTTFDNTPAEYLTPSFIEIAVVETAKEHVQDFVDLYMHMTTYDVGGSVGSTGGSGWCNDQAHGYYLTAKAGYNELIYGQSDREDLWENDSDFTAAKARYEEWARLNNDAAPYDGNDTVVTKINSNLAKTVLGINNESTNTIAIIVIISLVSVTAIGGYFFIKRRQEN